VIGFALVGVAAALYVVARQTSLFAVQSIDVRGASPVLAARVRTALAPLAGRSLVRIGSGDVAERLVPLPDVETASIDRSFPHRLTVTITTARRVAVLRQGSSAYVVSERGRVLAAVGRHLQPALPRIWAPASATISVGGSLGDPVLVGAVAAATAVYRGFGGLHVRFVRTARDELTYVLRSGIEVRLGTRAQLPLKLAIARRILATGGVQRYVDVSVPTRPVAGSNPQVVG
jgi:cell division protein FtsQ